MERLLRFVIIDFRPHLYSPGSDLMRQKFRLYVSVVWSCALFRFDNLWWFSSYHPLPSGRSVRINPVVEILIVLFDAWHCRYGNNIHSLVNILVCPHAHFYRGSSWNCCEASRTLDADTASATALSVIQGTFSSAKFYDKENSFGAFYFNVVMLRSFVSMFTFSGSRLVSSHEWLTWSLYILSEPQAPGQMQQK